MYEIKKILNLCFRWHILRTYPFVVEVTFKCMDLFQNQHFISCIMAIASHLIFLKYFSKYYIYWMCLIFRFADTWISQGESLLDNVLVFSGRRQTEVWMMVFFIPSHCVCLIYCQKDYFKCSEKLLLGIVCAMFNSYILIFHLL